jgi:NAD(P)-dependent dehydrogenase (short-subunit alcohol dehydrogenase family)
MTQERHDAKVALVTGGTRGLGLATARQLGAHGVTVLLGARDLQSGERAVTALAKDGVSAEAVKLDVTSIDEVIQAAEQIAGRHGQLDILVNNAGILPEATQGETAEVLDVERYRSTFETNVFGAVAVTQHMLPLLRRSPAGRIVNVSSTMGSLQDQLNPDSPYFAMVVPAYQGSKAALNAMTIALAKALRDTTIKVNSVCPGWLQTDLGGPVNKANAPSPAEEGARVVVDMALAADDPPSGTFADRDGAVAW